MKLDDCPLADNSHGAKLLAHMLPCIVHPVTTRTLRNFLLFLNLAATNRGIVLRILTDCKWKEILADRTVLAMGEKLSGLETLGPGRVTWINWSVLVPIRGLFHSSISAIRWMRAKRRRFVKNSIAFSRVYDFYPAHTRAMRSWWPHLSVSPFPIGLYAGPPDKGPANKASYDYDVCVVGSDSPRRRRVRKALTSMGISLSPITGDFEDLIERSRIVLNVHQHRCDNCEAHRILSAYAHGRVVVSEHIVGLHECLNPHWVVSASIKDIPTTVARLLAESDHLEELGRHAYEYYWNEFWPQALAWWERTLDSLVHN